MLRSDFDNHPLWAVLNTIDGQLQDVLADHQPEELPDVERIKTQMAYVRSFDVVASTRAAFFHPSMLNEVDTIWNQVSSSLASRINNGIGYANYVSQAADQAETGLMQMAAWPRPYGKGGEVKQMDTLFEQLLEAQRISIEALGAEHEKLRGEMASYGEEVESKRDEALSELRSIQATQSALEATIESQKAEVASAVEDATAAVDALTERNSATFAKWMAEREAAFLADFDPLRENISAKLASANEEYEELLAAKEKYTKLVSAIAADEVASQFESEADWGRKVGNRFYLLGFGLLVVAAVPLIWLIFEGSRTNGGAVDWTAIVIRLAIGVLAGSAATIAIRLGGRLIGNANAVKRMELELRAIGPFLANVADKPKVDDAFVDLVTKAFGNAYVGPASASRESHDENTPVTLASQVLDLIQKASKVTPS